MCQTELLDHSSTFTLIAHLWARVKVIEAFTILQYLLEIPQAISLQALTEGQVVIQNTREVTQHM